MVQKVQRILGLDIGSKYNGVAIIADDTGELLHSETCDRARLLEKVEKLHAQDILLVGIEKFVLYPWKAESKSWDSFENIQLIGVVKYLLDRAGIPYIEMRAVDSKTVYNKNRLRDLGYKIRYDRDDHQHDALSVALYARHRLHTKYKKRTTKKV